ncbi:hypothetical protein CDCA_CDCA07G2149 [Cyanidium caldarium]|uniref:Uncharacterized protein n=1 Tax=Cyanidium caldarium TaxID=2771 RepID=A0AAV9IV24_CYACA|nr:hypothetical protein CDCA_CDCA07G2149 [Cyanidium caldarium]
MPAKEEEASPPKLVRDVWKQVYLVGTEIEQIDGVYAFGWDFSHLDRDLSARLDGHRADAGSDTDSASRPVYLFGGTEPQLVRIHGEDTVVPIPVVVVVQSRVPPPALVGLKSVQRVREEIVPMRSVKMDFFPIDDLVMVSSDPSPPHQKRQRRAPRLYALQCEQRRVSLRNLSEERRRRWDYVLPYMFRPDLQELAEGEPMVNGDAADDTSVQVLVEWPSRPSQPLVMEYDWEMDDMEEVIAERLRDEQLEHSDADRQAIRGAIRDAVRARKAQLRAEREERRQRLAALTPEQRESLRTMQLIKYYPCNAVPDIQACKTRYINRYYGKATEVR